MQILLCCRLLIANVNVHDLCRILAQVSDLETRVEKMHAACGVYASALDAAQDQQQREQAETQALAATWEGLAGELQQVGVVVDKALEQLTLQWAAKQMQLHASEESMQVSWLLR
jgi:uncharacterized protein YukE